MDAFHAFFVGKMTSCFRILLRQSGIPVKPEILLFHIKMCLEIKQPLLFRSGCCVL